MLIFAISAFVVILSIMFAIKAVSVFMDALAQDNKKSMHELQNLEDKNTRLRTENKLMQLQINRLKEKLQQKDDGTEN